MATKKKWIIITVSILLIILLSISTHVNITSLVVHVFDSFATSDVIEVSIGVSRDSTPPNIIIDSPANTSYTTGFIGLNWIASDSESGLDTVWYNLNRGENTTLENNITLTLSNGDYTIYIFANDSVGNENGTESVSFNVNVPKTITVTHTRYDGAMTNFTAMNDEELGNITNLTLEIMSYGKIRYGENINISQDTDLDTHADISFNNIYINSNVLPNFNKPAILQLYGLTFTNPRILKDGSICAATVCNKVSYSGGTLEFTVTGFSNYSAEETPTPPTGEAARGGEGGGGGRAGKAVQEVSDFKVDKSLVKSYLTPGDTKEDSLKITNTGNTDIDVNIRLNDVNGIKDLLIIRENSFKLKTGEEKSVNLIFIAPEHQEPGIYTGQIIIQSGVMTKTVDVTIEIESKMALFDVSVEIPPQFKSVQPGDNVLAKISLYNLGLIKRADVLVEYAVKDFQNNVIVTQKRSLAVETQASLIGELQIPDYLEQGDYVFYTQVKYDDSIAIGSDEFKVVEKELVEKPEVTIYLIVFIAIVLFIIANIVLYYKLKKILKQQHRVIKSKKKRIETEVEPEKQKFEEKVLKEKDELKKIVNHIRKNLR